jgi:deoxyribodipyrimidine photo-lyase
MTTAIVWITNNIRLHDNPTLDHAIANYDTVIPVYVFDKTQYTTTDFSLPKTGAYRATFLIEAVQDFRKNLQAIGGDVVVAFDDTIAVMQHIISTQHIDAIYYNNEHATEEKNLQAAIDALAKQQQIKIVCKEVAALVDIDDLPFAAQQIPNVFTAFRHKVEKQNCIGKPLSTISKMQVPTTIEWGSVPSLSVLGLQPVSVDARAAFKQQGGETNALAYLQNYIFTQQLPATYFETRNQLIGANYSTKMSAWLACGCISARTIWQQVQLFEQQVIQNKSTYWIFFELLWRDFFKLQFVKQGNHFFSLHGFVPDKKVATTLHKKYFEQWQQGQTGVSFVDANMKELLLTGFMSNRGRQNVASYFINDLKMNWLAGAAYFESVLIDYDVYSNYGNWCYLAGVGNDPRENRYFNISKQASMYDADGAYQQLWLG